MLFRPADSEVYSTGVRVAATLAMCLVASTSSAQNGLRSASLPETRFESSIQRTRPDLFLATPETYGPRADRLLRSRHRFPSGGSFIGSNQWLGSRSADRRRPHDLPRDLPDGYLRLIVQPTTAEVHIDGFYLGTVEDFRRSGRTLEPGPHRVELRVPGRDSVAFNVLLAPYEAITYRSDFNGTATAAPTPPAAAIPPPSPAAPKTFYVIPGCYAGDKPPSGDRLPPACDITKLRTVPPVVSNIALAR